MENQEPEPGVTPFLSIATYLWEQCLQAAQVTEKTACSHWDLLALDLSLPVNLGRWYLEILWLFMDLCLF